MPQFQSVCRFLQSTKIQISFHTGSIYTNNVYSRRYQLQTEVWTVLKIRSVNLMFIGPCIIAIVDEWKTNLMSLAILCHLLCAQHVSDTNISIFRSLRLCWWITTSVVLFSVRCVLELWVNPQPPHTTWTEQLCFSLQYGHYSKPSTPKLQHTTNWEQDDRCRNSTTQSQAPDDGYINVRNMSRT